MCPTLNGGELPSRVFIKFAKSLSTALTLFMSLST